MSDAKSRDTETVVEIQRDIRERSPPNGPWVDGEKAQPTPAAGFPDRL